MRLSIDGALGHRLGSDVARGGVDVFPAEAGQADGRKGLAHQPVRQACCGRTALGAQRNVEPVLWARDTVVDVVAGTWMTQSRVVHVAVE